MSDRNTRRSSRLAGPGGSSSSSASASANTNGSSQESSRPVRSTRSAADSAKRKVVIETSSSSSSEVESDDYSTSKTASNKSTKFSKQQSASKQPKLDSTASTASSAANNDVNFDDVIKLEAITGLGRTESIELLKACNNNLEAAINIHLNNDAPSPSSSSSSTTAAKSHNQQSTATSNNTRFSKLTNGHSSATNRSNSNSSNSNDFSNMKLGDDDVRAPIPQKSDRLIDYDPYAMPRTQTKKVRTLFDGYRNLEEEMMGDDSSNSVMAKKKRTLAQLFRPPHDLMFEGSLEAAKSYGCKVNKWILLNVQDSELFECQCLNRDLWSDEMVKEIVRASFVFLQVFHDTGEGLKLKNYYGIHTHPCICILDPRTGEKLKNLHNKFDKATFCEAITSFLSDRELPIIDAHDESVGEEKTTTNGTSESATTSSSASSSCVNEKNQNDLIKSTTTATTSTAKEVSNNKLVNGTSKKRIESDDSDDVEVVEKKQSKTKKIKEDDDEKDAQCDSSLNESSSATPQKSSIQFPKLITIDDNGGFKHFKYESQDIETKNCLIRVSFPNNDRLDFSTSDHSKVQTLIDCLTHLGYSRRKYQLIERMIPNMPKPKSDDETATVTATSRNLFALNNQDVTFRDANLFPRIFLLIQEK